MPQIWNSTWLQRIRSLELPESQLDDADMEVLARSANLGQLQWLSLFDNRIGFAGAHALAASSSIPALRYANFSANPCNPTEQFSDDQGIIADSWMPEEGEALEGEFGPIAWLRLPDARTVEDLEPNPISFARLG